MLSSMLCVSHGYKSLLEYKRHELFALFLCLIICSLLSEVGISKYLILSHIFLKCYRYTFQQPLTYQIMIAAHTFLVILRRASSYDVWPFPRQVLLILWWTEIHNYGNWVFIKELPASWRRPRWLGVYISATFQSIESWKAHQLIQQDKALTSLLERLDKTSVLTTPDWEMKFLPQKFRETQADWFSKRGISWHISVVVRKLAENLQHQALVHIVENCSQDSDMVVSRHHPTHTTGAQERKCRNFNCLSPTGQRGVLPQRHHVGHLSTYGTSNCWESKL